MVNEQEKTVKGLQTAIQMEIDGKEYYLKASQSSENQMGKKLFERLADEEDIHRQKFEEIFGAIRNKKTWPKTNFQPDGGKRLRTIFARTTGKISPEVKVAAAEPDAVKTAMDMENKTLDFYTNRSKNASYDAERDFYQALAAEEREHHLVLLDYYEYLKDPAAWFVTKEHHSLDGG